MHLISQTLDLLPDPVDLARRLTDRPGVALLWSADGRGCSFLACDPVEEVRALDPEPDLALDTDLGDHGAVPRWVGILPYECGRAALERSRARAEPERRAEPHCL